MSVLLHIGASKCGSSALQTALTHDPVITRKDGSTIRYAAMDIRRDRLIEGEDLIRSAGVYRYKSSPAATTMMEAPLAGIGKAIRKKAGRKASSDLLLSSEGWLFESARWEILLDRLDIEVDVIVYVRPQVPVLNSAWWQWGAWSDEPFDQWMANRLKISMWAARIAHWKKMARVRNVMVRPVPSDIVPDFYGNVLRADPPAGTVRPNPSLPGPVLRLFQRNRILRPSAHASRIDFVLSEAVAMDDPSIWVMERPWIERVLAETRSDNEALLSLMDADCAAAMRDDPRWWSADAYGRAVAESPLPQEIPAEKLEEMCVHLAQALFRLGA